jgi:hypothetical protein
MLYILTKRKTTKIIYLFGPLNRKKKIRKKKLFRPLEQILRNFVLRNRNFFIFLRLGRPKDRLNRRTLIQSSTSGDPLTCTSSAVQSQPLIFITNCIFYFFLNIEQWGCSLDHIRWIYRGRGSALKILHYTRQICKTILGLRKKKKLLHYTTMHNVVTWDGIKVVSGSIPHHKIKL